jgi:cytochrome c oxidase cbb3-type subunit III
MRFVAVAVLVLGVFGSFASRIVTHRPNIEPAALAPDQVLDFDVLYRQNCSGCHGTNGKNGPAPPIGDPSYLAIADDAIIRQFAANGVPGTPMPAFAQSAGGMLADKQIDVLVKGIRTKWASPDALKGVNPPPYAGQATGDSSRGAKVYAAYCVSCHGSTGSGRSKAGSIVDGSFLALTSDRVLRVSTIVGRPEMGFPDWRNDLAGHPMSDQEISDVVAWMAEQRPKFPGQPYTPSSSKAGQSQ